MSHPLLSCSTTALRLVAPGLGAACAAGRSQAPRSQRRWQTGFVAIGIVTALLGPCAGERSWAQAPLTAVSVSAPEQLTTLLSQMDAAANSRNIRAVSEFYSPNFVHSDGLTRQTLQEALTSLWKRYPNLIYRTELKSWKPDGKGFVANTVTYITGTQKEGNREFKLESTLESSQQIENSQVVRQDILNERNQITSGAKPPVLKINLPDQVRAGQEFSFDAIVQEPLGDDLVLGTAVEELVKPEGYLNTTTATLEPLSSGGIFKVGRAPLNSENHWLSAVVVRYDGITMVTQRLRIVGKK